MSLHVISRANNRWKQGTWFACYDHGCQEVEIKTVEHRVHVQREIGLVLPFSEIKDYVTTTMRRGLNRFDRRVERPEKSRG